MQTALGKTTHSVQNGRANLPTSNTSDNHPLWKVGGEGEYRDKVTYCYPSCPFRSGPHCLAARPTRLDAVTYALLDVGRDRVVHGNVSAVSALARLFSCAEQASRLGVVGGITRRTSSRLWASRRDRLFYALGPCGGKRNDWRAVSNWGRHAAKRSAGPDTRIP